MVQVSLMFNYWGGLIYLMSKLKIERKIAKDNLYKKTPYIEKKLVVIIGIAQNTQNVFDAVWNSNFKIYTAALVPRTILEVTIEVKYI